MQFEEHRRSRRASTLKGLRKSLLINIACPYLIYHSLASHFPPHSVWPLGISGLIPVVSLVYGLFRGRALDVLALFPAEDIVVSLAAILIARTPTGVLIGRSAQSAILGLIFLGSLVAKKPLMLYIARQAATGNEPAAISRFDQLAGRADVLRVYRRMTLVWAMVLFAKSIVSVEMALILSTSRYLIVAPLVNYGADILLILWSFRYGHTKLAHYYETLEPLSAQNANKNV